MASSADAVQLRQQPAVLVTGALLQLVSFSIIHSPQTCVKCDMNILQFFSVFFDNALCRQRILIRPRVTQTTPMAITVRQQ